MGLDMYLYKSKKVDGFSADDYARIDNAVDHFEAPDFKKTDLEKKSGIKNANALIESLKRRGDDTFGWYSIFEEMGYWRKANHIHDWFVKHVQDGVDECQLAIVPKSDIEELLEICKEVYDSKSMAVAKKLLPTTEGFFFGGTDYDDYYRRQIESTIDILSNALNTTNFDKEQIFYRSSW